MNFEFLNSVKIISGLNSLNKLPYELKYWNITKPLILTDEGIKSAGLLDKLTKVLKKEKMNNFIVFSAIPVDSSSSAIENIHNLFKENNCDGLIALGGGSVIDTAKCVKLLEVEDGADLDAVMGNEVATNGKHLPFIVIPTTCGTGSECTSVAVVKNDKTKVKTEIITPQLLPSVAIMDATFIEKLPKGIVATTAIDALCHAIEGFSGKQTNVICNSFAQTAIGLIYNNLLKSLKNPGDLEIKQALLIGSTVAGICFSNSMVSLVHAIGHSLGSVLSISHGNAMAMLLPDCMRFNLDANKNEYAKMLEFILPIDKVAIIEPDKRAEKFISLIELFISEACLSSGVKLKINAKSKDLDKIANLTLSDGAIIVNKKHATIEDIKTILKQISE